VAGFIGSPKMNFLKGIVGEDRTHLTLDTGDHVTLPEHGFAQRPGQKVTLGLRPNDLRPDAAARSTPKSAPSSNSAPKATSTAISPTARR
jgi:ABC-type sugar transport system ATPase subunit